jgi:ubiquinone/menaquinone biosynthesis C-methylase UbiE
MTQPDVKTFYTTAVRQEWRRLVVDAYHRVELETTLHFMQKYLPVQGHVLDAGGGPGRYTLELARRGYKVSLFDLTPANLAFARRQVARTHLTRRVVEFSEGSVVDLSRYPDASFDAVACLGGPVSHVMDAAERQQALAELRRVAKHGAPVFISVMSRLSLLTFELFYPHEIVMPHFTQIRDTGDYPGDHGFTACHFYLPEELRADCVRQGLKVVEMAGLEGIATHHDRRLNAIAKDPETWRIWQETHLKTCTHPTAVGMSEHILAVCMK